MASVRDNSTCDDGAIPDEALLLHDEPQDEQTAALGRSIARRLALCSRDELRVVDVILERIMKVGRESYAPLDLARDERDWDKEAAEELADTLFYLAARHVAATDRRLERMRCEAADELASTNPVERGLAELRDAAAITTCRRCHGDGFPTCQCAG